MEKSFVGGDGVGLLILGLKCGFVIRIGVFPIEGVVVAVGEGEGVVEVVEAEVGLMVGGGGPVVFGEDLAV